jgi:hypothetical protein
MRKQACQTWDPFLGYPRRRLSRMTQAPWQIVVHRQVAKPKQRRCYAQETLLESFKGSISLPGQCKAALSQQNGKFYEGESKAYYGILAPNYSHCSILSTVKPDCSNNPLHLSVLCSQPVYGPM